MYLPLAHIYENLVSLFQAVWAGGTVNFVESIETLPQNLREISPTVFCSVPRIWEKFVSMITIHMSDSTPLKKALYKLSIGVGLRYVRTPKGSRQRILWGVLYWPLYWLVLYHLKRQLGFERIRYAVCAAAPASPELFQYYNALGLPLREGYGQTESTGVIAVQRIDNPRWGFVGEPLPGVEVKIAEDGEILAKGANVFKGYFKDPELTDQTIKNGWLHTGDVGQMEDGHLKILDRKNDILITAGGKNITPAYIENKLKFSTSIQHTVVIGDGRKFLTALILIDAVKLAEGGREQDYFTMKLISYLAELSDDPKQGWSNKPVGLVFTKADQCALCAADPVAYAQTHASGLWQHCQERFGRHKFFATGVAGTCAYRDSMTEGRVQVPLRIEPHGVIEPFEWLLDELARSGKKC